MEQGTSSGSGKPKRGGGRPPSLFVQIGQRVGRGVVIDAEVRLPHSSGTIRSARLRCDCGNEYVANLGNLVGKSAQGPNAAKSCGCLGRERLAAGRLKGPEALRGRRSHNFIDRTGQRYGRLVVIELDHTKVFAGRPKIHWRCRCDCGNEVVVWSWSLNRGTTRSCGCLVTEPKLPPGTAARNQIRGSYKHAARKRGLTWELTDEDFARLTAQPCSYCGLQPSNVKTYGHTDFIYNGLDRVDNDLGYTLQNVVPCCAICNSAKRDLSYDDFMAWIARLTEFHFFHPDVMPSRLLREVQA